MVKLLGMGLLSVLMTSSLGASAQSVFSDGNYLYQMMTSTASVQNAWAIGYVSGVHDAFNGVRLGSQPCFETPTNATVQQAYDVAKRWLELNPDRRQYTANTLVRAALSASFPCR